MKKFVMSLAVSFVAVAFVGCGEAPTKSSANNDQAAWQQFKGKKAQDELSSEVAKQKADKQ